jgi:hypothetical protein
VKKKTYGDVKMDPGSAKTGLEKALVAGWNNLMDSVQNGGSRIAVVEYTKEDLREDQPSRNA